MSRKVNYVSKATDGTYTVIIKGNTLCVKDEEGNYGAKLFADGEKFNVGKGFWHCFKQIKEAKKKIKVGDEVKVIDEGRLYDTYWKWFDDIDMVKGFVPYSTPNLNRAYTVARVAPHEEHPEQNLVAITDGLGAYYLIREDGLQKV